MQRPRQLQRGAERVRHLHLLCLGRRRVLPRHGVQRLRGGLLRGQLHSGVPASFSVQRGLFIFNNFNNFNFNNIFFHVWPPFFASFSPEFFFTFLAALHSAVSPRFLRLLSQNVLLRAAVCLHRPPPPKGPRPSRCSPTGVPRWCRTTMLRAGTVLRRRPSLLPWA